MPIKGPPRRGKKVARSNCAQLAQRLREHDIFMSHAPHCIEKHIDDLDRLAGYVAAIFDCSARPVTHCCECMIAQERRQSAYNAERHAFMAHTHIRARAHVFARLCRPSYAKCVARNCVSRASTFATRVTILIMLFPLTHPPDSGLPLPFRQLVVVHVIGV